MKREKNQEHKETAYEAIEKRSHLRRSTQISVVCSGLTAKSPDILSRGYMVNCSGWGACVVIDHQMQAGSIVMIRATHYGQKNLPEGFRTLALAEVKWSERLEKGIVTNYAIGLRYLLN